MRYQSALMYEYNRGENNIPLVVFDLFDNEIPNISQTTLPIKFLKARYLYELDSLEASINLLHDSRKHNPYIMAPEALISKIYLDLKVLDSAEYWGKKAFYAVPNNSLHRDIYFDILKENKDTLELRNAFNILREKNRVDHWLDYLLTSYSVLGANNEYLIKIASEFDKSTLISKTDIDRFNFITRLIEIGSLDVSVSAELAIEAEKVFLEKNYPFAAYLFDKASQFDPNEYTFIENAAIAYNLSEDYEKAEEYFNRVFNDFNIKNGKSEFYFGVMLLKLERLEEGCTNLKKASEFNYGEGGALEVYSKFCK